MILNRIICARWQELKPFNCVETMTILVFKQMSSNSFKKEVIGKVILTYHIYIYIYISV